MTLYASVEGRPPFDRGDAVSTMRAVVQEPPESPRGAGPLTPLLGGMLAKEPQQRYTLAQVRGELSALLAGPLAGDTGAMPSGGAAPRVTEPSARGATSGFHEVAPAERARPRAREPEPEQAPDSPGVGKKLAIAAVCLVLVLGLGYAVYRWQFGGGGGSAAEDPGQATEEAPAESEAPADEGGEGEAEDEGPDFATATHEGDGFSVAYPSDWGEGLAQDDFVTYYNTEDDTQWVRFYSGSERGAADPEGYLGDFYETGLDDTTDLVQVRLEAVEFGGMSGSVLEYTGTDIETGAERHSVWAIVDAGDGTAYGVFIAGPEGAWDLSQQVYDEALRSFQAD